MTSGGRRPVRPFLPPRDSAAAARVSAFTGGRGRGPSRVCTGGGDVASGEDRADRAACESLNSKQAASISTASRFPYLQHASGAATSRDAARLPAGGGRCEHEQVSGPKNRLRAVRAFGRSSRASAGRQAENGRENWAPICDPAAPLVETGRHCADSGQPLGGPARDSATPALTGPDSTHGRVTSCRGYYEWSTSILIGSTPTRSRPRLP